MPINNPNVDNPVQKYIRWSSKEKAFVYYDKDKEDNVKLDELEIIVLDELCTVRGFDSKTETPIRANEIRNTHTDKLNVNISGDNITGYWADIKEEVKGRGGKFSLSTYSLRRVDGKWELDLVQLTGGALSAWFDTKINTGVNGVKWTGSEEVKNKAITYYVPVYEALALTPEDMNIAEEENRKLQEYLNSRSIERPTDVTVVHKSDDVVIEDIDDKPIDLSEIPF